MSFAQPSPKVSLDTNETLFTVLTGINLCGYDQELSGSSPLRSQIRAEATKAVQASPEAKDALTAMCQIYQDHQQADPGRTLAQYVSLALYLNPAPALTPKVKEGDLPPDASYVQGILPGLQALNEKAGLHAVWEAHRDAYSALTERYHEPLAKMLFDTEVYLKLPSSGYLGRQFTVLLDPMGPPSQINARNYGSDYFVIISPGQSSSLKMEQIRHTYLHYLLDPMALKYPEGTKRIEPLLGSVKQAPMDDSFKNDIGLLLTESLIRAIEIRTTLSGKATAEAQREQEVDATVQQGFILTRYFYEALARFEKDPAGLRNAYGEMLISIDPKKEERMASTVQFAAKADPELLRLSKPSPNKLLTGAEERLSAGDPAGAQKLAQQAFDEKAGDPGRALFIMAQAASMNRDMPGAKNYFEKALEATHEPKVMAWSHIYLGRIFDLQEDRDAALDQYRAALSTGSDLPEAKAAAERGLKEPYEPPRPQQQQQ